MDANENSHEITIRIHEVQYSTVVAKLRKVFRNTDRMKFIKGLQSQKDYFILTLETRDEYAVSLYVRKEDLYVIAVAVRGGQIYEFRGYKEFAGSKSLPYGEGYGDLSTRVDFDNFTLVWTSFETAVEVLIQGMTVNEDKIKPFDWSQSLYIIIVTLTEGARNNIVAAYVQDSQSGRNPTTFMDWIQLLVNNWSRISDSANRYTSNITIKGLDPKERELMLGFVAGKTVKEVLDMLIASSKVCRAMLGILCQHPVRD
ncbi:ribonuclease H-like domain-containing protein [Tanacetum coccineum]